MIDQVPAPQLLVFGRLRKQIAELALRRTTHRPSRPHLKAADVEVTPNEQASVGFHVGQATRA